MSDLHVVVTTIDEVRRHPNADKLDLAVVGGWQCVVAKDTWATGEKCVFFPPDTVLPLEVSDRFNITQYLSKGRIKHTRLRGEPSFGLVVKPDDPAWELGQDVAEHYGATKYEPPRRHIQGASRNRVAQEDPRFAKYTEIDNLRNFPGAFEDGEEVIATEKIHGANCRIGIIDGTIVAGSRRLARTAPNEGESFDTYDGATYWEPLKIYPGIRTLLESYLDPQSWWQRLLRRPRTSPTVILYGEVFGPSVQNLHYGVPQGELEFAAFDLSFEGMYVSYDELVDLCSEHDIPMAPLIYRGPYDIDQIKAQSEGRTQVVPRNGEQASHIREGVVVRPAWDRRHPKVGRLVMKFVSDSYLLDGKKTDYTEE